MQSVVKLNDDILSIAILNVDILSVAILNVGKLSVVRLNVVAQTITPDLVTKTMSNSSAISIELSTLAVIVCSLSLLFQVSQ